MVKTGGDTAEGIGNPPRPRGRGRCSAHWMLAAGLALLCLGEARAVNKCTVAGRVTYQDAPCEQERTTVAQDLAKKERNEALHRQLDRLAAQGKGLVQRQPPPPPAKKEPTVMPSGITVNWEAKTQRDNAESAARLTEILDKAKAGCNGKLQDYPVVGMSDEHFRNCTVHARFGGVTQVVVGEADGVPLRLYLFPTPTASRVYSIGGVVTAVKP